MLAYAPYPMSGACTATSATPHAASTARCQARSTFALIGPATLLRDDEPVEVVDRGGRALLERRQPGGVVRNEPIGLRHLHHVELELAVREALAQLPHRPRVVAREHDGAREIRPIGGKRAE